MPAVPGGLAALRPAAPCRQPFPYSRCSAAAALAGLCACEAGRDEVRAGGGVALLKALVLQAEAAADAPARHGAGAPRVVRVLTPPALLRRPLPRSTALRMCQSRPASVLPARGAEKPASQGFPLQPDVPPASTPCRHRDACAL